MAEHEDLNKQAEEHLKHVPQATPTMPKALTPAHLDFEIVTSGERYQKISAQLNYLKESLRHTLQAAYVTPTTEERPRKTKAQVPEPSIVNFFRRRLGLKEKCVDVEQTIIDTVEVEVPINEGTPKDLQEMIQQAAQTLGEYNKEISGTVSEIGTVTSKMRELQKDYLSRVTAETRTFDQKEDLLAQYKATHKGLQQGLDSMKLTDNLFERTVNNYEGLDRLILETKYQLKAHHVNTVLYINQKKALRVYEKTLDFAKYVAENMMNYVDKFSNNIMQLNITMENVDNVSTYIAKSIDLGHETVQLMRHGQKYLAGCLDAIKQVYENPPTEVVDDKPFEERLASGVAQLDTELEQIRERRKQLDAEARPYMGPAEQYRHDVVA